MARHEGDIPAPKVMKSSRKVKALGQALLVKQPILSDCQCTLQSDRCLKRDAAETHKLPTGGGATLEKLRTAV